MVEPKFKVGDWVSLLGMGDKTKFRVLGIVIDTCSGGTQIHYTCRGWCREEFRGKSWYPATSRQQDKNELSRFNEIEVIPYVEKEEPIGHE